MNPLKYSVIIIMIFCIGKSFAKSESNFWESQFNFKTSENKFAKLKFHSFSLRESSEEVNLNISFDQSLPKHILEKINENAECTISLNGELIFKSLGSDLGKYLFHLPGKYKLSILNKPDAHNDKCNHSDELIWMNINVIDSKVEMVYDESFWTDLLSKNKKFENYKVKIPIQIAYFDEPHEISNLLISFAAVNTNLVGKSYKIKKEKNNQLTEIEFILNGSVGSGIYVMIDFIDNCENVKSFIVSELIK